MRTPQNGPTGARAGCVLFGKHRRRPVCCIRLLLAAGGPPAIPTLLFWSGLGPTSRGEYFCEDLILV